MTVSRIKKNDTVVAISGASEGKTGKVLQVMPESKRALVEGMNLVKKALRRTQDAPQGGIAEKESPIALSNLMPYCGECKRGVRVVRGEEGDKRVRKCSRCGRSFDS